MSPRVTTGVINRRITTRAQVEATHDEREGPTLDYKGDVKPQHWWELAKDVAALANHVGGVLLVGAFENPATRCPNLAGLAPDRIADIRRAYEHIARDRCRPSPVAVPHVIPWKDGREMLAVNVEAYPNALVGAQFYTLNGSGEPEGANAWQFYVRVDDDNVPLTPEVMPMYMNAHVRRVLVLLESIPGEHYSKVCVVHQAPGVRTLPEPVTLLDFSAKANAVHFRLRSGLNLCVPLDDVQAVWRDDSGGVEWYMGVSGFLDTWFPHGGGPQQGHYQRKP